MYRVTLILGVRYLTFYLFFCSILHVSCNPDTFITCSGYAVAKGFCSAVIILSCAHPRVLVHSILILNVHLAEYTCLGRRMC